MQISTELPLLYQDEHLVAVYKPSGLLVHRSPIDKRETVFALQLVRDQVGQHVFPVHRLDKPTSGVLMFALSSEVANMMMLKFQAGEVRKHYLAVVRGRLTGNGCVEYALSDKPDKVAEPLAGPERQDQPAVTRYRGIAEVELEVSVSRYPTSRYSLVSLIPRHGRRHQLRRHMRHIFHPVIGDTTHGEGRHNRFFRSHFNCHRLLLSATDLQFEHPATGKPVTIHADPDDSFAGVAARLGWGEALGQFDAVAELMLGYADYEE